MLRLGAWPEEFFASAVKMLSHSKKNPKARFLNFSLTHSLNKYLLMYWGISVHKADIHPYPRVAYILMGRRADRQQTSQLSKIR